MPKLTEFAELIHRAGFDGEIVSTVEVAKADAIARMDHDYWRWRSVSVNTAGLTLGELGVEIRRGLQSRCEYERRGIACFHTSDFPAGRNRSVRLTSGKAPLPDVVAQAGDILLARVASAALVGWRVWLQGGRC